MSSPQSLFDQCVVFIALNVDKVEDFVGFPSQIGEKIFNIAIRQPRFFNDHDYTDQTLNVFSEAFGEELMSSLNMAGEHLCLNYHLEAILKFQDLRYLDVSQCGLGDDHELLQHIAHLRSLVQLCLKGNAITDAGIQKMTIPFRMFKRGPSRLSWVELSGNTGVSVHCLKYFTQFPRLTKVVLSKGASSKTVPKSPWRLSEEIRPVTMVIRTQGWAQPVIQIWKDNNAKRLKNPKPKKSSGFYCRKVVEHTFCVSKITCKEAMEAFIVAIKDDGVTKGTINIAYPKNHEKEKQLQYMVEESEDHVSTIMNLYAACDGGEEPLGCGFLDSLDALASTAIVPVGQEGGQYRQSCRPLVGQCTNVLNSKHTGTCDRSQSENCGNIYSSRQGMSSYNKDIKGGRVCKILKPLMNMSAEVKGRTVDGKQHSSLMKTGNHCEVKYPQLPADAKLTNVSHTQSNKAVLLNIRTSGIQLPKYSKKHLQESLPLRPTFIPNFFKGSTSTVSCVNTDSSYYEQSVNTDPSFEPQKTVNNISECNVEVTDKQCKDRIQFLPLGNSDLNTNKTQSGLKSGKAQHGCKTKKINIIGRKRTFENYLEADSFVTDDKDTVIPDADVRDCVTKCAKKLKSSILDALDAY